VWRFLHDGYSILVADLDQTGRSPWARVPEIDPQEPSFRTESFLWEVFRIGPPGSYAASGGPKPYAGSRFPVAAFMQFAAEAAPRFHSAPEAEAAALDELVHRCCPCIILSHSAAGGPAMQAAVRWPALIRAVVSVEPSNSPNEVPKDYRTPHLFVWGDHLASSGVEWQQEQQAAETYRKHLVAAGAVAADLSLPGIGIHGNSHVLMLDDNSDEIASLIGGWLSRHGL
jgi:hypothetical protein